MSCAHCSDAEVFFDNRTARKELKRFRRRGPSRQTARLVEAVRARCGEGLTLLDIGGGVGAIQHRLADRITSGTAVDASRAYLDVAQSEAREDGYADRMTYVHGDFVELAAEVDTHDAVTLDRVLCCYPDMPRLVAHSASRAGRVFGVVFPRPGLMTKLGIPLLNASLRLRRSNFRVFLHDTSEVDAAVRSEGLRLAVSHLGVLWQTRVYHRG